MKDENHGDTVEGTKDTDKIQRRITELALQAKDRRRKPIGKDRSISRASPSPVTSLGHFCPGLLFREMLLACANVLTWRLPTQRLLVCGVSLVGGDLRVAAPPPAAPPHPRLPGAIHLCSQQR